MAKPWTYKDDHMLLRFHSAIGIKRICEHDLQRTEAAGKLRLKKLTESGARKAFAQSLVSLMEYRDKSGQIRSEFDREMFEDEIGHWLAESPGNYSKMVKD